MIKQSRVLIQIYEQTLGQQDYTLRIQEDTLRNIQTYLSIHEDETISDDIEKMYQPIETNILQNIVSKEDYRFIENIDCDALFDLANEADYLQIEGLVLLSCKKIATLIKGLQHIQTLGRTKSEIFERLPIFGEFEEYE